MMLTLNYFCKQSHAIKKPILQPAHTIRKNNAAAAAAAAKAQMVAGGGSNGAGMATKLFHTPWTANDGHNP